jgi:hypothetical protein
MNLRDLSGTITNNFEAVMSKKKQTSKHVSVENKKEMFGLSTKLQNRILLGLLLIILLILNKPTAIDGLSPQGTDVIASVAKTHIVNEFTKKTGELAFWNPAIFAGMPNTTISDRKLFRSIISWHGFIIYSVRFLFIIFLPHSGCFCFYVISKCLRLLPLSGR